jgi:hypothetical protein
LAVSDPDLNRPQQIGHTVADIAEKAQILVREEIELAKAEVSRKATRLGKGAAVLTVAGVFAFFGLIFFLHFLAWFFIWAFDFDQVFWGFLLVTGLLVLFAIIAALVGIRWVKKGSPPTPDMAIEEAKRIQETVKA